VRLEDIRRRDARDFPVLSDMSPLGRNYESRVTLEALQRLVVDRHDLLAEVARLESLLTAAALQANWTLDQQLADER